MATDYAATLDGMIAGSPNLQTILKQPSMGRLTCLIPYNWKAGCAPSTPTDCDIAHQLFARGYSLNRLHPYSIEHDQVIDQGQRSIVVRSGC